jgi:hypothetical protein
MSKKTRANTNATTPLRRSRRLNIEGQEVTTPANANTTTPPTTPANKEVTTPANNNTITPPTTPANIDPITPPTIFATEGQEVTNLETPLTRNERYHAYARFGLELVDSWRFAVSSDPAKNRVAYDRWPYDAENFRRMEDDIQTNGSEPKLNEIVKRIARMYRMIAAHLEQDI